MEIRQKDLIREIVTVRSRCCVILDRGDRFWLLSSDLADFPCAAGQEVDPEELSRFVLLRQYPRALNEAVAMLAVRPCARGEIEQKLVGRHYSAETVDMVLCKLNKENLLNDAEFSGQWARDRSAHKYGARRIYQELRHKGVSEEDARAALDTLDEEESLSSAADLAMKAFRRSKSEEDPRRRLQKVIQSLVRRGYDWDTAKEACRKALDQLHQDLSALDDE